MRRVINRPFLNQFLIGAAFVVTVTGLLLLLQSLHPVWFEPPIVVLAYLLAISLTSQWAGFYPSAAAAVIAFLCFNFFFIEPRLSLQTALVLERLRASRAETRAAVLEESDRLKTALLGSVSHELRTPLATIRAGAESLLSGLVPAESSAGCEILDDVRDASQRLTRLVDNMLDMTRIESGALKPALEPACG